VAQPTIARIETGNADPRVETLDRLLRACGDQLTTGGRHGAGVDRTQLRELLRLSPRERLELLAADATGIARLERAAR
jgi:predicted transcriptional regulator